ncbi:hypothetical protein N183_28140 [Sinorhizobium sp. Sb3]|nr:hypothetical protein N183_28140 [Sinorhizobium sp. Sb3]
MILFVLSRSRLSHLWAGAVVQKVPKLLDGVDPSRRMNFVSRFQRLETVSKFQRAFIK